ncbi:protoporphyrinogen oxidase [Paenibacillus sp. FSL H8-0537]|uniref:protoporphyrinogen oxidase n=1 Tax=Paenibacillus sp. FSL H8-0537 TaxID=2921399 RepID=UPI003100F090
MRRIGEADRIVIIGGGISGLSSAFYLQREAERQGKAIHITLVDSAEVLGGKINTLQRDGFVIERGPDSFLSRKLAIIELAKELGIESELTGTNPKGKQSYILFKNKLHAMPQGLVLGIPTEIMPFARTGLLSWGGKLRALLDFIKPSRSDAGDESLGGFLGRRLGTQVVQRIAEPLLAGIYAGDLNKLSIQATFPQFAAAERKHGSLIRGMRSNKKLAKAPDMSMLPEGARSSVFLTFKGGLSTLVDALDRALPSMERKLGQAVTAIHDKAAGDEAAAGFTGMTAGEQSGSRYTIELANGEQLPADKVIVTAPAFQAAELLEPLVDCAELRAVDYVSVANVVMAFDKASLGITFKGSGFVIPRSEGLRITACTWTSTKWLHTSPGDKVLLRCYVGRAGDQITPFLPDDQLMAAVREDVKKTMNITAAPLFTEITRLPRSMPQYPVGHLSHTKRLRKRLAQQVPGIHITGAAFDGVGLPDCIRQGKEIAAAALSSS